MLQMVKNGNRSPGVDTNGCVIEMGWFWGSKLDPRVELFGGLKKWLIWGSKKSLKMRLKMRAK